MKIFVASNKYTIRFILNILYKMAFLFLFLTQISVSNVKYTQILRVFHPNEKRRTKKTM